MYHKERNTIFGDPVLVWGAIYTMYRYMLLQFIYQGTHRLLVLSLAENKTEFFSMFGLWYKLLSTDPKV